MVTVRGLGREKELWERGEWSRCSPGSLKLGCRSFLNLAHISSYVFAPRNFLYLFSLLSGVNEYDSPSAYPPRPRDRSLPSSGSLLSLADCPRGRWGGASPTLNPLPWLKVHIDNAKGTKWRIHIKNEDFYKSPRVYSRRRTAWSGVLDSGNKIGPEVLRFHILLNPCSQWLSLPTSFQNFTLSCRLLLSFSVLVFIPVLTSGPKRGRRPETHSDYEPARNTNSISRVNRSIPNYR